MAFCNLLREIDVIPLPSDFIDDLIAKQYAVDKVGLLKMFHQGNRLMGVLKIGAASLEELSD